jgi:hypothetical protein
VRSRYASDRAKFNLLEALKSALLAGAALYPMIGLVRLTVRAAAALRWIAAISC